MLASAPALAGSPEQQVAAVDDAHVTAETRRDEKELRRLIDDRFLLNSDDGTTDALLARPGWLPLCEPSPWRPVR